MAETTCKNNVWEAVQALPSRDFPGGTAEGSPPANAGAWVQSLVQEDSTCLGATKPVRPDY